MRLLCKKALQYVAWVVSPREIHHLRSEQIRLRKWGVRLPSFRKVAAFRGVGACTERKKTMIDRSASSEHLWHLWTLLGLYSTSYLGLYLLIFQTRLTPLLEGEAHPPHLCILLDSGQYALSKPLSFCSCFLLYLKCAL